MSPSSSEMPTALPGARSGWGGRWAAPEAPWTGAKPRLPKKPRAHSNVSGEKPERLKGNARGRSVAPSRPAGGAGPRQARASAVTSPRGRRRASRSDSRSSGRAGPWAPKRSGRRAEAERGPSRRVAVTMSPKGVMPAMVSFENGKP